MRIFLSWKEIFWASGAIVFIVSALKAPSETVKAIYFLCMTVSMATAFLLRAIREK